MREVTIRPVQNGFLVRVGCSEFVFSNIEHLAGELIRYQKFPEQVEKEYCQNAINKIGPLSVLTASQAEIGIQEIPRTR